MGLGFSKLIEIITAIFIDISTLGFEPSVLKAVNGVHGLGDVAGYSQSTQYSGEYGIRNKRSLAETEDKLWSSCGHRYRCISPESCRLISLLTRVSNLTKDGDCGSLMTCCSMSEAIQYEEKLPGETLTDRLKHLFYHLAAIDQKTMVKRNVEYSQVSESSETLKSKGPKHHSKVWSYGRPRQGNKAKKSLR